MNENRLRKVCRALGVRWYELAAITGQAPSTMRKRFYEGRQPRAGEAAVIIRELERINRTRRAVSSREIREMWGGAA